MDVKTRPRITKWKYISIVSNIVASFPTLFLQIQAHSYFEKWCRLLGWQYCVLLLPINFETYELLNKTWDIIITKIKRM